MGVIPQDMAFYEELTAKENLYFWGKLQGLSRRNLEERIQFYLEKTGLVGRENEPLKKYSGGMKRRINLIIGLIHQPKLLLLDEPTIGIDVQTRLNIYEIIKETSAHGTTILYTTHNLQEAEDLCHRIAIITGKWASRLILGMAQITLLFLIGKILFKTYLGNSILSLFLVAFFFCGTIAGMSIMLGSIIKKEEVLVVFNILLANLMGSLGGCWIPTELFPAGLRNISFIFPPGWAMDAFHKLIFFGYNLKSILLNILALFLFSLLFLVLAIKFFKLRKV